MLPIYIEKHTHTVELFLPPIMFTVLILLGEGAIAGISTLGILEFNYLTSQVQHTYTQKKAASCPMPYFSKGDLGHIYQLKFVSPGNLRPFAPSFKMHIGLK